MKAVFGALARALAELIESESGEFCSTREKSRLLDAMMKRQGERENPAEKNHPGWQRTRPFATVLHRVLHPGGHAHDTQSPA